MGLPGASAPARAAADGAGVPIVVVESGARRAAVQVDSLAGRRELVIKPLGGSLEHVRGASGATILGSGDVALVLDVPWLVHPEGGRSA